MCIRDRNHPLYNSEVINHLKDLFADLKLKENNSAKELENSLTWWKRNASTYNPLTATDEEEAMFLKAKKFLAIFGLKESDPWDKRNKEMQDALAQWSRYKDTPIDQVDESAAAQVKKVKDALLQLKRDGLTMEEMKDMAKDMDDTMTWYLSLIHI